MSETTSKPESPDAAVEAEGDDDDDDLAAALFGDDDVDAENDDAIDTDALADDESNVPKADDTPLIPPSQDAQVKIHNVDDGDQEDVVRQRDDERNRIVMGLMTEEQLDRYEAYRRSGLGAANLRKALQAICGHNVGKNMITVVRGLAKVFVGEIVETASLIAHEQGESPPLQPVHYRTAYQQLQLNGKVPHKGAQKRLRL